MSSQDIANRGIMKRQSAGVGKLTVFVFGTITAVVLFAGYNIFPFYYYYFEIENQFRAAIRVASTESDQVIRQKLMYHIKKMQLPVESDDLVIERLGGNRMRIYMAWTEVFYISYQGKEHDIWEFDFVADVEDKF